MVILASYSHIKDKNILIHQKTIWLFNTSEKQLQNFQLGFIRCEKSLFWDHKMRIKNFCKLKLFTQKKQQSVLPVIQPTAINFFGFIRNLLWYNTYDFVRWELLILSLLSSLNQAKFVISFTFIMGFQKIFYNALSSRNFLLLSRTFAHENFLLTLHQQEFSAFN